jgi:hypothetical protein
MYFDTGEKAVDVGYHASQQLHMMRMQKMRDAVPPYGVEAGIAQEYFNHVARRWVAL